MDKLKYITNTKKDFLEEGAFLSKDAYFIPSGQRSMVLGELFNGKQITNWKGKETIDTSKYRPVPYRGHGGQGNIYIEDSLRTNITPSKKSCEHKLHGLQQKTFPIFNEWNIPEPVRSVETCQKGFVHGRGGMGTRMDNYYI